MDQKVPLAHSEIERDSESRRKRGISAAVDELISEHSHKYPGGSRRDIVGIKKVKETKGPRYTISEDGTKDPAIRRRAQYKALGLGARDRLNKPVFENLRRLANVKEQSPIGSNNQPMIQRKHIYHDHNGLAHQRAWFYRLKR